MEIDIRRGESDVETALCPRAAVAWDAALTVGLALLALIVFAPAMRNGFVGYDDEIYLTANSRVQAGLTWGNVRWAFTTFHGSNWHPLTWLSHMGGWSLFGSAAFGHHLINVLLHAFNAALVFLALRALTRDRWPSAFAAAVFATHPLHVESVAWAAERKDVLSAFFVLWTLLAYARFVRTKRRLAYGGVVFSYAFALLAKPMAVTLPFVLLLMDYWPLGRRSEMERTPISRLFGEKAPLFVAALASCIVTLIAQAHGHAIARLDEIPLGARVANAVVSYWKYIGKTFWPMDLAVMYPHPSHAIGWIEGGAAGLALLLVTVIAAKAGRKRGYLIVGWLWFAGMLVPVIGIVQVGSQSMADRYMYLPLTGLTIMAAWGLRDGFGRWKQTPAVFAYAAAAALVALSAVTQANLRHWRDGRTLFSHAAAVTRDNAIAHYNLGTLELREGHVAAAERHLLEAVRINPGYADAHANLGALRLGRGDYAGARAHLEQALRCEPRDAVVLTNLAIVCLQTGLPTEAARHIEQALTVDPGYPAAVTLGKSLGLVVPPRIGAAK